MSTKSRIAVVFLALGVPSNEVKAFDKENWSFACQRAIKSIEPCELSDTYIEFSCERVADNASSASLARREIESTIRSACSNQADEPTSSNRSVAPQGGNACVITTACSELCGLSDDCFELSSLRAFRERYMMRDYERAMLVRDYYRKSPEILDTLTHHKDRARLLAQAYAFYVLPAALMASIRLDSQCFKHYRRGVRFLAAAAA